MMGSYDMGEHIGVLDHHKSLILNSTACDGQAYFRSSQPTKSRSCLRRISSSSNDSPSQKKMATICRVTEFIHIHRQIVDDGTALPNARVMGIALHYPAREARERNFVSKQQST